MNGWLESVLFVLVVLFFIIAIMFTFSGPSFAADSGELIPIKSTMPTDCNSQVWECRRCDRAGRLSSGFPGGGCICRFCVAPASGKTVEGAYDLRTIHCVDNKT